jgi:hypothetical protein
MGVDDPRRDGADGPEFRYDHRPVATLQGMDPSRVVLLGSVSKTVSPALGIGWIVAPQPWTRALHADSAPTPAPSTLDQLAFATFIESGSLDCHLRSCRLRYRKRRDALVSAIRAELPGCNVSGIAAGLHVLLHLLDAVDAIAVTAEATSRGVHVADLDRYCALPGPAERKRVGRGDQYEHVGEADVDEFLDPHHRVLEVLLAAEQHLDRAPDRRRVAPRTRHGDRAERPWERGASAPDLASWRNEHWLQASAGEAVDRGGP